MTAPDIARLMNNIRVHTPGATDDAIQFELFNALDDFFKGSNVWQEDVDIQIPAGDPAGTIYEITPNSPSAIVRLMWVFQVPTDPNTQRGPQIAAAMNIPGELTLRLQPSETIFYRVTVALTVDDPVARNGYVTLPAWIIAKYRDVLIDGVLGRMFVQPAKPWTNNQLGVMHSRKFKIGTGRARIEANRNNTYRQQAWVFPPTAGGSQRGRTGGWAPPQ